MRAKWGSLTVRDDGFTNLDGTRGANTFRPQSHLVAGIFAAYRAPINRNNLEACMLKTVLAGALALAMTGPLSVSEPGFGPAPAVAQEARRRS